MIRTSLLIAMALIPGVLYCDSSAYIVAGDYSTGSIVPFYPREGRKGIAYFAPPYGEFLALHPVTKQLWQITELYEINILDSRTGNVVSTISTNSQGVYALIFDPAGRYAYVTSGIGVLKIDCVSRSVVGTATALVRTTNMQSVLGIAPDGSRLFVEGVNTVIVIDTGPMTVVTSIPHAPYGGFFVANRTLFITSNDQLLYYNAATLQQIKAVPLPLAGASIFGISGDGSELYLLQGSGPPSLGVADSFSGKLLLSQSYPDLQGSYKGFLAPDNSRIVLVGNLLASIDVTTLGSTAVVVPVALPSSEVFLDSNTLLTLSRSASAIMTVDQLTGQLTSTVPFCGGGLYSIAVDKSGEYIYGGSGNQIYEGSFNLTAFSTRANREVKSYPIAFGPSSMAGVQLYSGQTVYNLVTGIEYRLQDPAPNVSPADFTAYETVISPDSKSYWLPFGVFETPPDDPPVLIGSGIAVYDTGTDVLKTSFAIPKENQIPIVFSRDSSLAYVVEGLRIFVYDTSTFQVRTRFIYGTAFTGLVGSPDGLTLYATDSNSVFAIDSATGAITAKYPLPAPAVGQIAISPDGGALFLLSSPLPDFPGFVELLNLAEGQVTTVQLPFTATSMVVLADSQTR